MPSRRTVRTASSRSSMRRPIAAPQARIVSRHLYHLMSCRQAISFRRHLLRVSDRTFPVRSRPGHRKRLRQPDRAFPSDTAGTRLIGIYDSQVAFGQSRVLLVWTRLIMPNGRSIVLERQPGADAAGYSGLEDDVDNHWGVLFKAALLSTLLGVGSELGSTTGTGSNSDVITALRRDPAIALTRPVRKSFSRTSTFSRH